eukprot:gene21585-35491_t
MAQRLPDRLCDPHDPESALTPLLSIPSPTSSETREWTARAKEPKPTPLPRAPLRGRSTLRARTGGEGAWLWGRSALGDDSTDATLEDAGMMIDVDWEDAGMMIDVDWEAAGMMIDVDWEAAGMMIDVDWEEGSAAGGERGRAPLSVA